MKGQYFLITAMILSSLFFLALPLTINVASPQSEDFSYIAENLRTEFPHAVNLGIRSGTPPEALSDFTGLVRSSLKERFIDSGFLWIIAISQTGSSDLTVYAGNFLGSDQDISLSVDGDTRNLPLSDSSFSTETFSSVSSEYSLSLSFQGESKSLTWKRDKANLYVFSSIMRGGNMAKIDITG